MNISGKILFVAVLITLISSCKLLSKKNDYQSIYLIYTLAKDSASDNINAEIPTFEYRKKAINPKTPMPIGNGQLICFQIDKKGNALDSVITADPFVGEMEIPGDSGRMNIVAFKKTTATVKIYMNYHNDAKKIQLQQIRNDGKNNLIIHTKNL